MAAKRCGTIGCKAPVTHILTYSFPESRDVQEREYVCEPCGQGYLRRPALKATLETLPVKRSRKRNKLFVWHGVLSDYSSGMAVALAPTREAALALLEPQVSEYDLMELRATEPTVIDSLTCEPQEWHVKGGG